MVQGLLCKALDMDISVDYITIILGKDIKEKKYDAINMSVFICKWEICKQRNCFVSEMQLTQLNTLW